MGMCHRHLPRLLAARVTEAQRVVHMPLSLQGNQPSGPTHKEGAHTSPPQPHPLSCDLERPGPPLPPLCFQRLLPFLAQAFLLATQPGPRAIAMMPGRLGRGLARAAGQVVLTGGVLQRGAGGPLASQGAGGPGIICFAQRVQGQAAALHGRGQQVAPLCSQGPGAPAGSLHGDALGAAQDLLPLCSRGQRAHPGRDLGLPVFPRWHRQHPSSAQAETGGSQHVWASVPAPYSLDT